MKDLSIEEYITEIKYCYENSRWEFSYYAVLYSYLCQFRNNKIKLVQCSDWRSRGKKTSETMRNNLKFCSVKFTDKDNTEHIGGIPDFQFVPSEYSYGNSCEANAFVEFKAPEFSDEGVYQLLKYTKNQEIEHQFLNCNKIIFTDGFTWCFLERTHEEPTKCIELIENEKISVKPNHNNWIKLKDTITDFIKQKD